MNTLRNINSLQPQERLSELFRHGVATRHLLEQAWDESTAYQGIALRPSDPISRGQCGVSSLWLAHHLADQEVDAYFTEGKIHLRDDNDDDHVWVEVNGIGDEPLVIDITSDQYQSILGTSVHMGSYANPPESIGRYTPLERFKPHEVPRKKLLARFVLLQENVARAPKKYHIKVR